MEGEKLNEVYVTVDQAAQILGVSSRSVYSYIENGRLESERIGQTFVIRKDLLYSYQRRLVGRPRQRSPDWHIPVVGNLPHLLQLTIQVREGKQAEVVSRIQQMRHTSTHTFPGTVARYIAQNENIVLIALIWREQTMPDEQQRTEALNALRMDLADVLDWKTATIFKGYIFLTT